MHGEHLDRHNILPRLYPTLDSAKSMVIDDWRRPIQIRRNRSDRQCTEKKLLVRMQVYGFTSKNTSLAKDLSSYLGLTCQWECGYLQCLKNQTSNISSSPIGSSTITSHNEWTFPQGGAMP